MSSRRRRSDAMEVLVCTDSRSSVNDARSKLEFADARDSQSAPNNSTTRPIKFSPRANKLLYYDARWQGSFAATTFPKLF